MFIQISFQTQRVGFVAEFFQNPVAQALIERMPLMAEVQRWGDEIFFETHINAPADSLPLTGDVNVGDVAYWPEGRCICVFFGPTPASAGSSSKPVPASPVIVIGKTVTLIDEVKDVLAGQLIRVSIIEQKPAPAPAATATGQSSVSSTPSYSSERKLSQTEIDVLVKQVLADIEEKKRRQAAGQ